MHKYIVVFLWSWCILPFCVAQEMVFSTQVSSTNVGLNNRFQVMFTIKNAPKISKFQLPALTDFVIVGGPMQSSSFSNINGASNSTVAYTYFLQPKRIGKFTILGATAIVDGKLVKSNDVNVTVSKGNTPPNNNAIKYNSNKYYDPANDPFFNDPTIGNTKPSSKSPSTKANTITEKNIADKIFARVDVDKKQAYIGEQITANYNIYSQVPLEAGIKKAASPAGFWAQDLTAYINPQDCERVTENGKEYRKYTLRKTALFATQDGQLNIPEVTLYGNVEIPQESSTTNGGLIGGLINALIDGGNTSIPFNINTTVVPIAIKPLPTNTITNNYSIGNYTIESTIDKGEVTTDQSASLIITVKGNGNIKMIQPPILQLSGDFEKIEPSVFDTITAPTENLAGYKRFIYTLSPRNVGALRVPEASFTFFNTTTQTYETINTNAYTLNVTKGKLGKKERNCLPTDINDIHNTSNVSKQNKVLLPEEPLYWCLYLLPLAALIFTAIHKKVKDNKANNITTHKNKDAQHIATNRLVIVQEMLKDNNNNGFYNETNKALWLFLSDKLGIPLSKLNKNTVWEQLATQGINSETIHDIQSISMLCETNLYGGGEATNKEEIFATTKQIIVTLEQYL